MSEILNKYGVNALLKYNVISDDVMRKLGFTDYKKDCWYKCIPLHKEYGITFNITIPKNTHGDLRIDVLDEAFAQPYDYQYMLERNPANEVCLELKNKVEKIMEQLQRDGVISGFYNDMYI